MARPVRRELSIPNETRFLASLRDAVREVVAESGFPEAELNRLMLAVDESVTNVMEHAYENDLEGEMTIEVSLEASDSRFAAHVRDRGTAFDPTAVPAPDLSEHLDEGRRHGLGIFLIRQIMDEITYTSRPDGWNELELLKSVRAARPSSPKSGEEKKAKPGSKRKRSGGKKGKRAAKGKKAGKGKKGKKGKKDKRDKTSRTR